MTKSQLKFFSAALVVWSVCLASCASGSRQTTGTASPPQPAYVAEKIRFTQATGCLNDGSYEFCIPANDPDALAAVLAIAPQTSCIQSRGRAGCQIETQVLCMVEVRGMCRGDLPEAMTDGGWQTVCDLAALPFVQEIVPTWYE